MREEDYILFHVDFDRKVEQLEPNESRVIKMHFIEGYTLQEIGKVMGYSRGRVWQIKTKGLRRLKHKMGLRHDGRNKWYWI